MGLVRGHVIVNYEGIFLLLSEDTSKCLQPCNDL